MQNGSKLQGGQALPVRASYTQIAWASGGGLLAILLLAYLAERLQMPLILGSFGASCVLIFGFPDSPFSQGAGAHGNPHGRLRAPGRRLGFRA